MFFVAPAWRDRRGPAGCGPRCPPAARPGGHGGASPSSPEPLGCWGGGPGLRKPAGGLAGAHGRRQLSPHCPFPPGLSQPHRVSHPAHAPPPVPSRSVLHRRRQCSRPPQRLRSRHEHRERSGAGRASPPRLAAGGGGGETEPPLSAKPAGRRARRDVPQPRGNLGVVVPPPTSVRPAQL